MSSIEIVVGSGNTHKIQEIATICASIPGIRIVPFSDYEPVPEIDENGTTFAENAAKKAHLLAQYLYARRGASASGMHTAVAADYDDEDDLDQLAAARARRQAEELLGLGTSSSSQSSRRRPISGEHPAVRRSDVLVMADDSGLTVDALQGNPGVQSARYAGTHGDDKANNAKLMEEMRDVPADKRSARFVCNIALATQHSVLLNVRGDVRGEIVLKPSGSGGFGYDPLFYYPPYKKTFGEISPDMKNAVSHRANALRLFKAELLELLEREELI